MEIAEACLLRGKKVRLFDIAPSSLASYYDKWFTDDMDKAISAAGIETHFGEKVLEYKGNGRVSSIVTESGEYPADLVINAIGFVQNNALGKDHLELWKNGAYSVDKYQQTSDLYSSCFKCSPYRYSCRS